jgi:hypothetical protein
MSARTLLRAVIVALVALQFFYFYKGFWLSFVTLAHGGAGWLDVLSALGPFCLLAAAGLAIANTRLVLACLLIVAAPLLFSAPLIPFVIGVMVSGKAAP